MFISRDMQCKDKNNTGKGKKIKVEKAENGFYPKTENKNKEKKSGGIFLTT